MAAVPPPAATARGAQAPNPLHLDIDPAAARRGRIGRRLGVTVLALVVVAGLSGRLGASSGTTNVTGGGRTLTIIYPAVARPGLPVELRVVVEQPGGFTEPVRLGFDRGYLAMVDVNDWQPPPSAGATADDLMIVEFEAPVGDELVLRLDCRIDPGQWGRQQGRVVLMDGDPPLVATLSTFVLP